MHRTSDGRFPLFSILIDQFWKSSLMCNSVLVKSNIFFIVTFLTIVIFVSFILFAGNDFYWYGLAAILVALQIRFKISISGLFPIIAILTLTEYYFLFSGKRVYLCELVYIPLVINYFLTDFLWKQLNYTKIVVLLLIVTVIIFQGFNFLINSDSTSSFFRIRSMALPLFLIVMIDSQIKTKADLKRAVNIVLFVSILATFVVYLQFFTGGFYILQNGSVTKDDLNFIEGYLTSTEDSFLFNLVGLHIKGPMPPVGLNYFKFGYSEKILVPAALLFASFKFQKERRHTHLLLFIFLLMATLLTGSRSILLTFLFTSLITHLFYKRRLKWGFILFIIFSFFAVTYLIGPLLSIVKLEEFGTLASRMFYMEDFFQFIRNYPSVLFAGKSPESFLNLTASGQPPHHFFAFGIVYDGIIVTSILFFAFYKLLKSTRVFKTDDRELLSIGYGLWVSLFGFVFIYGQTSYLTWSIPHNMFFCIVIGLLIATHRISRLSVSQDKEYSTDAGTRLF